MLVELLRGRAERQPGRLAYTFRGDGEQETARLTYQELDRQARGVAAKLQDAGAAGQRVLLLYPPGLDYVAGFFGCLYAGAVAVPVYPPDPARLNRTLPRLVAIVEDARPQVVLALGAVADLVEPQLDRVPALRGLRWVASDRDLEPDGWREPAIDPDQIAFLQYTSGSTGTPRGVMVSHRNVADNSVAIQRAFGLGAHSRLVSWLPTYHDMGLIGCVLQPLYGGFPALLMPPTAFLERPLRWLRAISEFGGTVSGGPNFGYDLTAAKVGPADLERLDLSCWSVAFNGAEPVRAATLRRFAEAFAPCGFRAGSLMPCYGLAEATLLVTSKPVGSPPVTRWFDRDGLGRAVAVPAEPGPAARELVSCGHSAHGQELLVVDPDTGVPCPPGRVGEIWVAGAGVAAGYWGRPDDSQQTFGATPTGRGGDRFLRTGDLGFRHDGELFLAARRKDVIIVAGRNYFPQDVEQAAERAHPVLRVGCVAAFDAAADDSTADDPDADGGGTRGRVVVVQEVRPGATPADLAAATEAVRAAVAEQCDLSVAQVVLVERGEVPKTSSGKVQRNACRARYLDGSLRVVSTDGPVGVRPAVGPSGSDDPEWTDHQPLAALPGPRRRAAVEARLRGMLARVLPGAPDPLPADRSLTALGMDSLGSVEVRNGVVTGFGVQVPLARLLGGLTLTELTDEVTAAAGGPGGPGADGQPAGAAAGDPGHAAGDPGHAAGGASAGAAAAAVGEAPLSRGQQALWFLYRLAPDSSQYNQVFAARVTSELDVGALRRALDAVVARHAVLRTTYGERDGRPYQRVHDRLAVGFEHVDASGWTRDEVDARLDREAHRPFDLGTGPIVRVLVLTRTPGESFVLFAVHHIVMDFWSLGLVVDELATHYAAASAGHDLTPGAPPPSYVEWIEAAERRLAGPDGDRLWDYWRGRLAANPTRTPVQPPRSDAARAPVDLPVLDLPVARPRPPVQTDVGATHTFSLPDDLARRVRDVAAANDTTPYTVLLAAFQVLLHRYSGQDVVVVGSPMAGRDEARFEGTVGYFVNMVPLRGDLSGRPSFQEVLDRTRREVLGALDHQAYPFPLLVDRLAVHRDPSRSPLFQVAFLLQKPYRLAEPGIARFVLGEAGARMRLGPLRLESAALEQRLARFDLELWMVEDGDGLSGSVRYNADLFDRATVAGLAEHYRVLLGGLVDRPDAPVGALPLLDADERHRVLDGWNDTAAPYGRDRCLHELVEDSVRRTPDATAVVFGDRSLSYRELNEAANRIADHLVAGGLRPGEKVAVVLDRGVEMVPALLGVLKAGGAYVPLEPSWPVARVAWILDSLAVRWVLTQTATAGWFADREAFARIEHVVCLDEDGTDLPDVTGPRVWLAADLAGRPTLDRPRRSTPDAEAYVIFTSGSTGTPKGVVLQHRPVVNTIEWVNATFGVGPDDRMLFVTSLCFDLSVYDVFGILAAGGCVHVASTQDVRDPGRLATLLRSAGITFWDSAPAALAQLVPFLPEPSTPDYAASRLRLVFLSGDWIPVSLPGEITSRFAGARVVALGGATEAAIWSNYHPVERVDPSWRSIPYGRPIQNARYYVLDRDGNPCPVGVPGELHIGGECLAVGYANDPAQTAARFVPDPFDPRPGARMYRTGDRVRFWPDGTMEFMGRTDQMVKVRGYRIEPGEIETLLARHPDVREAMVLPRSGTDGQTRLVAYVSARPRRPDPATVTAAGTATGTATGTGTGTGRDDGDRGDVDQVTAWEEVFDSTYRGEADDPTFDTAGWVDSHTGEPFTAEEMTEWVATTVDRVLALPHRRVLEVGCGTGLLLSRIAPHCRSYVGLDVSRAALDHVRRRVLAAHADLARRVELRRLRADQLGELAGRSFDVVVVNSVAQYFGSVRYLVETVRAAVELLAPGGAVFLGDLRNLRLLDAMHTSVQLHRADGSLPVPVLRQRVRTLVRQERELLVDPALFEVLPDQVPGVAGARVLLKRGPLRNELSAFRYDVVLSTVSDRDGHDEVVLSSPDVRTDLARAVADAVSAGARRVRVPDLPNARVRVALAASAALGDPSATVAELRAALSGVEVGAVDPWAAFALADALPGGRGRWCTEAHWPRSGDPGCFDLVVRPATDPASGPVAARGKPAGHADDRSPAAGQDGEAAAAGGRRVPPPCASVALDRYTNSPALGEFHQRLVPALRAYLRDRVPEYMLPAAFVVVDGLPVTPNGKVDRAALPEPDGLRSGVDGEFVAAGDQVEQTLARVWARVLGVDRVGVHDRFFELGGDSILAIQVVAEAARDGVEFGLRDLFRNQTVAELAAVARVVGADGAVGTDGEADDAPDGDVPLTPVQRWFLDLDLPVPDHFNQAVLVDLGGRFDPDAVQRAVRAVFDAHDALRLRFRREPDGRWTQFRVAAHGVSVAREDLRRRTPAERATRLAEVAAAANATLDLCDGPTARAVHLAGGNGEGDLLLLVAHHLVVDGVSWRVLLSDLDGALRQATAGGRPAVARPATTFARWARTLAARARSAELRAQAPAWARALDPAGGPAADPAPPPETGTEGAARTVVRLLEATETDDLLNRAGAAYRTRVDELLLAALARATAGWAGRGRVRVDVEGHGRDSDVDLDLSRTVGWFTTFTPLVLDPPDRTEDVAADVVAAKERMRGLPGSALDYGLLCHLCAGEPSARPSDGSRREAGGTAAALATLARLPRAHVGFTYLGRLDTGTGRLRVAAVGPGPLRAPANLRPYPLEVNAYVLDGRLRTEWTFDPDALAGVDELADRFVEALREIVAHCLSPGAGEYTPSDFPLANLDGRALGRLLDQVRSRRRAGGPAVDVGEEERPAR